MEVKRSNNRAVSIKVNPTSETVDTQYQLEIDRLAKKRELRTKQYNEYRILFYGTPKEKEDVRYVVVLNQSILGKYYFDKLVPFIQCASSIAEYCRNIC